jgi:hypothetical protein
MHNYLLLTAATITIFLLGTMLWKRTGNLAFPFGIGVFYFWSLHGGWSIITDLLGGDSGKQYHYLYEKMFPVQLDEDYIWTLGLYAAFIIIVVSVTLCSVRPARLPCGNLRPIMLSHDKIIIACGFAAVASLWIIHYSLEAAAQLGESAYRVTRSEDDIGWYRVHQVLNRVALLPSAIGFAVFVAGGRCRYFTANKCPWHFLGYLIVLGFMFCLCVVLGNKNELAFALFLGCLFYLVNSTRPRLQLLATLGIILLSGIGFIDFARGFAADEITSQISVEEISSSLLRIVNSNESFAAHMSLYGAMHFELPFTYGSSAYSLLTSVVPRMLWPDRPNDIYYYYAIGVGAREGQGYSIHHATGWYLNFGVAGVVLGAILLGRVWAALYNNLYHHANKPGSGWWRMFCIIGFITFTANLPSLIRCGPEGYKGIIVDSFMIPIGILLLSRVRWHGTVQTKTTGRSGRLGGTWRSASPQPRAYLRSYCAPKRKENNNGCFEAA